MAVIPSSTVRIRSGGIHNAIHWGLEIYKQKHWLSPHKQSTASNVYGIYFHLYSLKCFLKEHHDIFRAITEELMVNSALLWI